MILIEQLQEELKEHQFRCLHIPKMILKLIKVDDWKFRNPSPKKLDPKRFIYFPNFVEEVRPWGLQTDFKEIEKICSGFSEIEFELGRLKSIKLNSNQNIKKHKKTEKQKNLEVLKKHRFDLYNKVLENKITVYRAMIEGGFKKPRIKIQKSPESFSRYIKLNFSEDERRKIIELIKS